MLSLLRKFWQSLPTLFTAFAMALAVWVLAVNAADPTEERNFPRSIPIEIVGQDPGLLLTSPVTDQLNLTLRAPRSIWDRLVREQTPIRALVDLSGFQGGEHSLPVQIQIGIQPVKIISYTPQTLKITLEAITSRSINITLIKKGIVAVGYQEESPILSQNNITVTGPDSLVNRVKEIRATLDVKNANENINRVLPLQILDKDELEIKGLTIIPDSVNVTENITQRGGFRNVVVKVMMRGQVARGYRVTNISVLPPTVTVYSSDPKVVDGLPGFIETVSLDMANVRDNLDERLSLNLPPGINLIGDQTVDVQVGVSPIESSLTLNNMPVTIIGLPKDFKAQISPATVDVILSGPLPILDTLSMRDVHVVVDLSEVDTGTIQRIPRVELNLEELRVQSILPATVEVTISPASTDDGITTPSPTPKVTLTPAKG